jgi:hypothetical protein
VLSFSFFPLLGRYFGWRQPPDAIFRNAGTEDRGQKSEGKMGRRRHLPSAQRIILEMGGETTQVLTQVIRLCSI